MNKDKYKIVVQSLFDEQGMCKKPKRDYFDDNGDLLEYNAISWHYMNYPAESDIVRMYYAEEYADETRGNYSSSTLYLRAYS